MALADLIKAYKHRPSRKVYIKRRAAVTGAYESNWQRIDNWNGKKQIIEWGSVETSIDENPNVIGSFNVSGVNLIGDNNEGIFNNETFATSIWSPDTDYLNRRYTKIKIDTAYLDSSDAEVGEATDFEGLIDTVLLSENGTASIGCLSYQSIFTRYPIQDLSLTGAQNASAVITAISNQAKITIYMPYVAPNLSNDYEISDTSLLDGTYWDIIQEIAYKSDSTIVLEGSVFKLVPRSPGSVVWNFNGEGSDDQRDIIYINEYDDEGIGRVRVYWKEEDGSTFAKSSDTTLLLKYLSEPELVDLSNIASGDKQGILNALLSRWESNIQTIEFETKYLINQITLLDKITLDVRGRISPGIGEGGGKYGLFVFDDGTVYGQEIGGIIISSGNEWLVTKIVKDLNNWSMTIRAERVT